MEFEEKVKKVEHVFDGKFLVCGLLLQLEQD